jgi:hypothetical protein
MRRRGFEATAVSKKRRLIVKDHRRIHRAVQLVTGWRVTPRSGCTPRWWRGFRASLWS